MPTSKKAPLFTVSVPVSQFHLEASGVLDIFEELLSEHFEFHDSLPKVTLKAIQQELFSQPRLIKAIAAWMQDLVTRQVRNLEYGDARALVHDCLYSTNFFERVDKKYGLTQQAADQKERYNARVKEDQKIDRMHQAQKALEEFGPEIRELLAPRYKVPSTRKQVRRK